MTALYSIQICVTIFEERSFLTKNPCFLETKTICRFCRSVCLCPESGTGLTPIGFTTSSLQAGDQRL